MKIVAIIQARMGSTRFPGKILKKVLGKTLLEYQLERVQRSKLIDEIVIATTTNKSDDVIVELCNSLGISTFRGSEENVLSRYYETAVKYEADVIVRITSDCPLIDPDIIDKVIQLYLDKQPVDYASNTLERTFPRGLDTEVFSFEALKKAHEEATLQRDREHVTAFIYTNRNLFSLTYLENEIDYSYHRWTVDTKEDFDLISLILEAIYPNNPTFTMKDVIVLLNDNPDWLEINAHIEQKKI